MSLRHFRRKIAFWSYHLSLESTERRRKEEEENQQSPPRDAPPKHGKRRKAQMQNYINALHNNDRQAIKNDI